MSDLAICEVCKLRIPAFYHPGYMVETETGKIHADCLPTNFAICAFCHLKALPKEIMKAYGFNKYVCPDCHHGAEHGPKEVD